MSKQRTNDDSATPDETPRQDWNLSFSQTAVRAGYLCAACLRILGAHDTVKEGQLPILATQSQHPYRLCEPCAGLQRRELIPMMQHLITTLGVGGHA